MNKLPKSLRKELAELAGKPRSGKKQTTILALRPSLQFFGSMWNIVGNQAPFFP